GVLQPGHTGTRCATPRTEGFADRCDEIGLVMHVRKGGGSQVCANLKTLTRRGSPRAAAPPSPRGRGFCSAAGDEVRQGNEGIGRSSDCAGTKATAVCLNHRSRSSCS